VKGGRWLPNAENPDDSFNLRIELNEGDVIWPMHRVQKRFENGAEDSLDWYGHRITTR
jgi:hypothetical protein